MAVLRLEILGGFSFWIGSDRQVALPKKVRAMLAYMAVQRSRTMARETLGELLWSNRGSEQIGHSLRQALAELRRRVGEDQVILSREGSLLLTDRMSIDVAALLAITANSDISLHLAAMDAYVGPLLAGFPSISTDFDDWLALARIRIDNLILGSLGFVVAHRSQAGDAGGALAVAERMVAIDPLRDDTQRILLRAYAETGRRSDGLRTYDAFVQALKRDLGVSPDRETQELALRLRREMQAMPQPMRAVAVVAPARVEKSFESTHADPAHPPVDHDEGSVPTPPDAGDGRLFPKNSVAVLPFNDFGADSPYDYPNDYFADGVVDDIITELSHFRSLFVIARNSSFSYKNRGLDMREIARDLGVEYAVEGSIRRSGNRLRISAFLAHARSGVQLWAERFDTEITDIFAVQDTISRRIASAIEPKIEAAEIDRARGKPTENLDAYDLYLRALPYWEAFSPEGHNTAIELLAESVRRDPGFAPAMAVAASCHAGRHDQGWTASLEAERNEGLRLAFAALRLREDDATVLCLAGHAIACLASDFAAGSDLLDRALVLNPSYAQAWIRSAMVRIYMGDSEAAIRHAEIAMSLSPRDPRLYIALCAQGYAYLLLEDHESAIRVSHRALVLTRRPEMAYRIAITANWCLGREAEMRRVADLLLQHIPTFCISNWRVRVSFTRGRRFDIMENALRAAGMPD